MRKGDVLLKLETEKLDRAIADLAAIWPFPRLAIRQAGPVAGTRADHAVGPGGQSAGVARGRGGPEVLLDMERPFALKAVDFSLKMAKEQLEYEEEELHQLEKMYKADDITEETEQIVLKRARDTVDRAKFMVQATQLMHDQAIKFAVPRRDDEVKEAARRRSLEWEKSKIELPLALQKLRLDLEKLQLQRAQTEERLKKLLADRELMTVESPIDGIVYYGKLVRGKPGDSAPLTEAVSSRGVIQANQVVMTVVQPRPMRIRATAPENQLSDLRPGLKGVATPTGYADLNLPSTIDDVSDIPVSPGNFDVRLTVDLKGETKLLMPGMTCKVKLGRVSQPQRDHRARRSR